MILVISAPVSVPRGAYIRTFSSTKGRAIRPVDPSHNNDHLSCSSFCISTASHIHYPDSVPLYSGPCTFLSSYYPLSIPLHHSLSTHWKCGLLTYLFSLPHFSLPITGPNSYYTVCSLEMI